MPIISLAEVKEIAGILNVKKTPGLDALPNAAMKRAPDKTLFAIANITNAVMRSGHFSRIGNWLS